MKLNSAYLTFNGEQNSFGIGSPAIFVRLQGCPLRCYKKTLGVFCDTPEALAKSTQKDSVESIISEIEKISISSKVKLITLTGGDPLWNDSEEITYLLKELVNKGYVISIETSGTISWLPYTNISENVHWVLDYKLKSCGLKDGNSLFNDKAHLDILTNKDYIKYVVYDEQDYNEMLYSVNKIKNATLANITVGAYWSGKIESLTLFESLSIDGLLDRVIMNFQNHKLVVSPNYLTKIPTNI